jgi:hypothetical protein
VACNFSQYLKLNGQYVREVLLPLRDMDVRQRHNSTSLVIVLRLFCALFAACGDDSATHSFILGCCIHVKGYAVRTDLILRRRCDAALTTLWGRECSLSQLTSCIGGLNSASSDILLAAAMSMR